MIEKMRNIDLFDAYLNGLLNRDDKAAFEKRLSEDDSFKTEFEYHKNFVLVLQENARAQNFKNKLKKVHTESFGKNNIQSINKQPKNYLQISAIAASVALFTILVTVYALNAGGFLSKKQASDYTELKREVSAIKNSQNQIIRGFSKNEKKKSGTLAPANFTGTGFAINTKGYFITSLHLVKGNDSIFIENSTTERLSARVIYTDTPLDIAILKIDSSDVLKLKDLPYSFKSTESDLGENVFTLGYPSQDIVYGEGSISSSTRSGDTNMYQISIPLNPGNSGGPLIDEYGNVTGVVSGKNQNAEGTSFASKSNYISQIIANIQDEELKNDLVLSKRNGLRGLKRSEQIKRISPFVFNVYVYKGN
jgi:S1-C subfamily serine protease